MSSIALWLSNSVLALAIATAGFHLPSQAGTSVGSLSETILASTPDPLHDRLTHAWEREQAIYERIGRLLDRADERIARAQQLIDKARTNGKDVSALQAALNEFSVALKNANPIYESGKGIVASHKGFDAEGNVVDTELARQTVRDMHAKLKEIRGTTAGPGKALRDAIKAFREANRPTITPSPTADGS